MLSNNKYFTYRSVTACYVHNVVQRDNCSSFSEKNREDVVNLSILLYIRSNYF